VDTVHRVNRSTGYYADETAVAQLTAEAAKLTGMKKATMEGREGGMSDRAPGHQPKTLG
jgi:hypothetical protein